MTKNAYALHPSQRSVLMGHFTACLPQKFNNGGYIKIFGEINISEFIEASDYYCRHNSATKMKLYKSSDEEMCQTFDDPLFFPELKILDFSSNTAPESDAMQWMENRMDKPFELICNPLSEQAILKISYNEHWFFLKQHHIAADAFTFFSRIKNVLGIYTKIRSGEPLPSKDTFPCFSEEIIREQNFEGTKDYEANKEYWYQALSDLPPTHWTRFSVEVSHIDRSVSIETFSQELWSRAGEICNSLGYSIQQLVLLCITCALSEKHTGKDFVVGIPLHNRVYKRQKTIAGMLASVIPLKFSYNEHCSILESLANVKKIQNEGFLHRRYPWADVYRDIKKHVAGRHYLFDFVFGFESFPILPQPSGIKVTIHALTSSIDDIPMRITVREYSKAQPIEMVFNCANSALTESEITLFSGSVASKLIDTIEKLG